MQGEIKSAADIFERLHAGMRPCVRARHSLVPSRYKLGGLPMVPTDFQWPTWNGKLLQFLCQLDLNDIQRTVETPWLPQDGILLFFYDYEQSTWGFDPNDRGSWSVHYLAPSEKLAIAELPISSDPSLILPEQFLSFDLSESLPDPINVGFSYPEIPDEAWERLDKINFDGEPAHQIGGYPGAIQNNEMELECQLASNGIYVGTSEGYSSPDALRLSAGSPDWRLMLQLDTDDSAEMMWGDVGRLYFWIRETDGASGDFSNAWMILQCS
jgi:uncharacterized protein YwqG